MNPQKSFTLNVRGRLLSLAHPCVMGILNATPDSFYAGSRVSDLDESALVRRVRQMVDDGAGIVDIGACSTRPGYEAVSSEEEIRRLSPVLKTVRREFPELVVSVDTFQADVARFAVEECGADIVNDISGGRLDRRMFRTVADLGVPYVLTHYEGSPKVHDVLLSLSRDVAELRSRGVNDVIVDPGFGFGKDLDENYAVMRDIALFHELGCPLLVGVSRKSMVSRVLDCDASDALNGSTALHAFALSHGVQILRAHDVKAAADCVKIMEKLRQ